LRSVKIECISLFVEFDESFDNLGEKKSI